MLDEKLEYLCQDDYRPDYKPMKPLLEQLFEGMAKPRLLLTGKELQVADLSTVEDLTNAPKEPVKKVQE